MPYVVNTIGGLQDWPTIDPSWIPPGVVVPPGLVTPQPPAAPSPNRPPDGGGAGGFPVGVALVALSVGLAIGAVVVGMHERRPRR